MSVSSERESLSLRWDMPLYDDESPPGAGRTDGLWHYEVVECFLAAPETGGYMELEFGPYGHWLALEFDSYRRRARELEIDDFIWQRGDRRWCGSAKITAGMLVSRLKTGNAYLIHGASAHRCYHAATGHPTHSPDFHRIELFPYLWTD